MKNFKNYLNKVQNSEEVSDEVSLNEANFFGLNVPTSKEEFKNLVAQQLVSLLTQNSELLNSVLKKLDVEVTIKGVK